MGSLDSKEQNFQGGNLWILNLWVDENHTFSLKPVIINSWVIQAHSPQVQPTHLKYPSKINSGWVHNNPHDISFKEHPYVQ